MKIFILPHSSHCFWISSFKIHCCSFFCFGIKISSSKLASIFFLGSFSSALVLFLIWSSSTIWVDLWPSNMPPDAAIASDQRTVRMGVWGDGQHATTGRTPPGGGACHARLPPAVQAPLTNRTLLTTSRSLGYSRSVARREGRGQRSEVRVSRQQLEERKKKGSNKDREVQNGYKMEARNEISVSTWAQPQQDLNRSTSHADVEKGPLLTGGLQGDRDTGGTETPGGQRHRGTLTNVSPDRTSSREIRLCPSLRSS